MILRLVSIEYILNGQIFTVLKTEKLDINNQIELDL